MLTYPTLQYKETTRPKIQTRDKDKSEVDTLLSSLKGQIDKCKKPGFGRDKNLHSIVFGTILQKLQSLPFKEVSAQLLKSHFMLDNESGLPQLFDKRYSGGVNYPWYIKADAEELYNKWCRRIFETDLLRGIKSNSQGLASKKKDGTTRNTDSIDPSYPGVVSAKYVGNGDLLNGQWWPTQLCTLRDGAHGETMRGISGKAGQGAYSCVMAAGHSYVDAEEGDVDEGDTVQYCGKFC